MLSEQDNLSREYTLIEDSMNRGDDPVEKAHQDFRKLCEENEKLEKQIISIQSDPGEYIKKQRDQITAKINLLKEENELLKRKVDQDKIPFCSKYKRVSVPNNENVMRRDSLRSSAEPSLRNSITARTALSEISSTNMSDKNDMASTCLNAEQHLQQKRRAQVNPLTRFEENTPEQEAVRQRLTLEINYLLDKTEVFEETVGEINRKERSIQQRMLDQRRNSQQSEQLSKIQEYKKKLLRLLNRLKSRQCAMNETVKHYKKLHEQTLAQLHNSMQALKALQQAKVDSDVESKYAEVLELEERLQIINAELEEMDEEKWLSKIYRELALVLKRLGVSVPTGKTIRECIDEACYVLIEGHLSLKKDTDARVLLLKQYHEEEKVNNQKMIQAYKNKEQLLSKRLNDFKMGAKK